MTRRAKGTNLVLLVQVAKQGLESGQIQQLGDEARKLLDEQVLVSEWYPFEQFEALLEAVHEQMLGGSDQGAVAMGEANATEMLEGVHKIFVVAGDPLRTLKGISRIWSLYFDFGRVVVETTGDHTAKVRLEDYAGLRRCHGLVLLGWLKTAIRMSGSELTDVHIEQAPWEGTGELLVELGWRPVAGSGS